MMAVPFISYPRVVRIFCRTARSPFGTFFISSRSTNIGPARCFACVSDRRKWSPAVGVSSPCPCERRPPSSPHVDRLGQGSVDCKRLCFVHNPLRYSQNARAGFDQDRGGQGRISSARARPGFCAALTQPAAGALENHHPDGRRGRIIPRPRAAGRVGHHERINRKASGRKRRRQWTHVSHLLGTGMRR